MRKTFLSFVLAAMIVFTVIPAICVNAQDAVDLLHDTDGDLRHGVYIHSNRPIFTETSAYSLCNAFDNNDSTAWLSKNGVTPFLQVNFPVAQQITEITVKPSKKSGYDVHKPFEIRLSDDYNFETYETVCSFTASDWESGDFSAKTVTVESTEKYRYVQLYWTNSNKWAALAEIDIKGYPEDIPSVADSTNLTEYPDVLATSMTFHGTSIPQKAIDGNEDTMFYDPTAVAGKYILIDLRRKASVERIDLMPLASYDTTNEQFRVQVSNDPTFGNFSEIYYRDRNNIPAGKYAYAYGRDGEEYRYVRVIKTDSQLLGFKEIKVWGTPSDQNVTVKNVAKDATVTASNGEDAFLTVDGSFDGVFTNTYENASVTYTFEQKEIVTSVSVLTRTDAVEQRRNFCIYGSIDGTFEDAEVLGSVGEEAIANGMFANFGLDDVKAFKAIKIEKTSQGALGLGEVRIICDSSDTKVEVTSTVPSDGAENVTNIDGLTRLVEIELNRKVSPETITPDNIIITNLTKSEVVEGWKAYSVSDKTFTIDIYYFESDSQYQITLTEGILAGGLPLTEEYTFTFKTGKIINVSYDPNKIIKNVAVGKKVTGNTHTSYGKPEYMCDGLENNNYTHTQAGASPNLQIDLGNFYDVVAFEILHHSYIDGLEIRTSSENVKASDMTNTVATVKGNVKQTILSEPVTNARFIGITRTNTTYTVIKEFKVYALISEEFGAWSASSAEITDAGTYTLSLPVTNYTDSKSNYIMMICAYDSTNKMIGLTCEEVTAECGKESILKASIVVDERAETIKGILLRSIDDSLMLADVKMISKSAEVVESAPEYASDSLKDALKFETTDNSFTISGTVEKNTSLSSSDRVTMYVFKPGYDPKASYTKEKFKEAVCLVDAFGVGSEGENLLFSFDADDKMPYGIYNIKLTKTDKNYNTEEVFYTFIRISPAEIVQFINEFKALTEESDYQAFLRGYIQKGFLREDEISEVMSSPDGLEKMCVYLTDIYEENNTLMTITDIINCCNGAYVLSVLEQGNAQTASSALKKYGNNIYSIYDSNVNLNNFLKVFVDLKDKITDSESLKDILNWSCVLSYIQDSSRKSVEEIMKKEAALLGCDLSYAENLGVSLSEIAVYISTDKASDYYGGAFKEIFKAAADKAKESQAEGGSGGDRPQSGGGNKGSSGGGGSKFVPMTNEEIKRPETIPAKPVNNLPFNDIENISWAKDYIVSLYEKGIVSGNGNGNFEPDRLVKREEFVKMLVEALELDMQKMDVDFDDCNADAWFYPYVQIAAANGIVNGVDKYNFGIGQTIKRQDMAVMIEKALVLKKAPVYGSNHQFVDDEKISEYAKEAVDMMYTIGIISGFEDGSFSPNGKTTRAQAAVIIGRALEYMGGAR